MTIRLLRNQAELELIIPLIKKYQEFYLGRHLPTETVMDFFNQYLPPATNGFQMAAWSTDNEPQGFCTVYFVPTSLSCRNYALMNDLYVSEDGRGQGIGKKLIASASQEAQARGYSSLEWITQDKNTTAQKLYDSLPAEMSIWRYYSLPAQGKT